MPVDGVASALLARPRDGTVLVLKADGSFDRVDPEKRLVEASRQELPPAEHQVAAFSPDGSLLAAPTEDGSVGLLDPDQSARVGEQSRTEWGANVAFAPDGSQFASVQPDRVRLWDGYTGAYQASVPLPDLPAAGRYSKSIVGPARRSPTSPTAADSWWRPRTDGRTDLDREDPHQRLGGPRLPDRRSQPDAGRVGPVLPQPALRDHLRPVAPGDMSSTSGEGPRPRRQRALW